MARIVKEYAVRRDEILDAGQRLVYTKGYEQMSVQDIIDELQIAKGTFYHYFDSKQALLEAIIARMIDVVEALLVEVVDDPTLPALEKLQRFFTASAQWKNTQQPFLRALLRVWYTDDNALVRHKVSETGVQRIEPLLKAIIYQGIGEGAFTTNYPDYVGDVVLSLGLGLNDTIAKLFLSFDPEQDDLRNVEATVAVYTDAMERVLGIPPNSLQLVEMVTLKDWFSGERVER